MKEQFVRTAMLLGEGGIEKLKNSRVAVFGLGGVGGHAVEALVRSGIGTVDLIDNDTVNLSNLNRQIIAAYDTIGSLKTEAMAKRIALLNPECRVNVHNCFYLPECSEEIPFREYDFILDAIDTVTAKIDLAVQAQEKEIPIISCMGTGNKLNPQLLEIADLYQTSVCPLAKVMRKECKARGIRSLPVVYSKEPARTPYSIEEVGEPLEEMKGAAGESDEASKQERRRATPGSTAFVPAAAGLMMAGYAIRRLTGM